MSDLNRRVILAVALALTLGPTPSLAQAGVDIVQIWRNFIATGIASHECGDGDIAANRRFQASLTALTVKTAQTLQRRNPLLSQADVVAQMRTISDQVEQKVEAEIRQNTCASKKTQVLLKLYKVHALMRF